MPRHKKNPNHPKKGSTIKVEPIRDVRDIQRIKRRLVSAPRDLCLFTLGINTAYRASELLSIRVGDVAHLKPGDRFELKQQKTKKYRATTFNKTVVEAVQAWLAIHPDPRPGVPLFVSRKGGAALTVSTFGNMVKDWCRETGLSGNYGSHSLRKTWGYHQRIQNNAAIPILMVAFGHTTQQQTLEYLCIQAEEIQELYALEL
ncbi:MAG TPA: site-specific integrase [Alteromonas australica]|jgi:integrase|uniref:Site-specific integrase n=1 Tax=Alteromonas australica TaxID=589873 RepID=A0A350P6Y3_9ALTE|nr:tyrosine-type recombinase/integrase [Alphaproteobacteria bacterium]MBO6629520.1 tyrosine-type recombinase/integrase [Alphaproteobacteria bacterium]MDF1625805.1 tyrosine-type recombinase/integrase [Parvibaculaceae bacterium]HAW77050.1 site-specific integrase [Alteromonas australica]